MKTRNISPCSFLSGLVWTLSFAFLQAQPLPGIFKRIPENQSGGVDMVVNDVIQDREGFIWIATFKGLYRHDGHDMRIFRENPYDPNTIGDSRVTALAEGENDVLWIGTANGGVSGYDRRRETFTHIFHDPQDPASLLTNHIEDLLLDDNGYLWIATSLGLDRLQPATGKIDHFLHRPGDSTSLSDNNIGCLEKDDQGRIWLGTRSGGLNCLDLKTGKVKKFLYDPQSGQGARVIDIARDDEGQIWISTNGARLYRIDPHSFQIEPFAVIQNGEQDRDAYNAEAIWPDTTGGLWLGTVARGLIHFSPQSGRTTIYRHDPAVPSSIASDLVTSLWTDRMGDLWIGHAGPGLSRLTTRKSGFEIIPVQFQKGEGQTFPAYRCVVEDQEGRIWIGTYDNGLYRYDPLTGLTTAFKYRAGNASAPASNTIWDMLEDQDGVIWLATHGGLQRFDPARNSWTLYHTAPGTPDPPVRSLWEDKNGRLWAGTFEGLYWLDTRSGILRPYNKLPNNPAYVVNALFEDSRHNLWISAFGHGIYRLNLQTEELALYQNTRNNPRGISSNFVSAIAEDTLGRIWLGTESGGLNLFEPDSTTADAATFRHWSSYNEGFPDDNIYHLSVDDRNHLWASTDLGLFSFDPATDKITTYDLSGTIRGLIVTSKPREQAALFVGNSEYVYRFLPDSIWRNNKEPPVFITSLEISGKPVQVPPVTEDPHSHSSPLQQSILYTRSLELKHRQNNLAFVFTALNFIHPENNRYLYQLEGYDDDWIETTPSNRRISYTNLDPGEYTFRVIASNNHDTWNRTGQSISIRIFPPWWRTLWAWVAYGLLFLFLLWWLRRRELRRQAARSETSRLKELDKVKSRLITNITHEFRTPLTVILGMARQIKDHPKKWMDEGLEAITRNGHQLLKLVNQMLDLSRLEAGQLKVQYQQGDIVAFLGYLVQSFQSFAAARKVNFRLIKEVGTLKTDFAPDLLSRVVNNLLSNAFKFTPPNGEVTVSIRAGSGQVEISIEDNGPGIPEEHLPHIFDRFYQVKQSGTRAGEGTGIGLALVREIVEHMKGEVRVSSTPGVHTAFQVRLPISHSAPEWSGQFAFEEPRDEPVPAFSGDRQPQQEGLPLVLIIEDNTDVANYIAGCLHDRYRLELARNGRMGIKKAVELVPDMVISDLMMPEADGYEVCETLKNDERTSHIPIILLTARADEESRTEGLRRGADAYLAKPFNREELEVRLQKLIELRRRLLERFSGFPGLPPAVDQDGEQEDSFLQKLHKVIHQNLENEDFGIQDLCRELNVSRSQLHRKLTALTGRSASHVIRTIRLEKAKELVRHSPLNISQIAFRVGFSNASYFSAAFAEEFGMSPSEMREKDI